MGELLVRYEESGIDERILRAVEEMGIEDCTQCMCCSYICPSRQSVAGEILLYRQALKGGEEQ